MPWDVDSDAPPSSGAGAPSWLQQELAKITLGMARLEESVKPLATLPARVAELERAQSKSSGVGKGVMLALGLLTAGGGATAGAAISKVTETEPRVIVVDPADLRQYREDR